MKARRTEEVDREYRATTAAVRRAFDKQARLLIEQGPDYHSLRVHPWPADGPDAMPAYVNKRARFYYGIIIRMFLRDHAPQFPGCRDREVDRYTRSCVC